jgi:quinate dehydrogenase
MASTTPVPSTTIIPNTSNVERHGYLFGHPITHSLSPLLHQTVYDGLGMNWTQFPLDSLDMDLFLKLRQDPKFYGMMHSRF